MNWISTQNKPKATFKQRGWFIRFQVSSEDPIWNSASFFYDVFFFFFSRCSYSLLVMNNSAENIWTHFLLLVLHTHRKCLGDPRWAMLRAIIIGAHDAGRVLKMNKWTDIYGLHLLSSCLHDYTCVAGNMDLLREESVTVNSYPLLHGLVWHWEAYSGWELIFSISFLSDGILHEHSIFYQS